MQVLISAFSPEYSLGQNLGRHNQLLRHIKDNLQYSAEVVNQTVGDSRKYSAVRTLAILIDCPSLDEAIIFNRLAERYDQSTWYMLDVLPGNKVGESSTLMKVSVQTGDRTTLGNFSQADKRTALCSEFFFQYEDGRFFSLEDASA